MSWGKSKAHHEPPPKVEEEPEELSSSDWSETTPDTQVYDPPVAETPDPREEALRR